MTAKEYLSRAFHIDRRITGKLKQIEDLKDLATKITSVIGDLPKSPAKNTNELCDAVASIMDLEKEVAADVEKLLNLKREIAKIIEQVPKAEHRLLLEKRYLNCERWESIAATMGYDRRYILKLHNRALDAVRIGLDA